MDDFKKAAMEMLSLGPRLAIVTLGPKGALVAIRTNDGDEIHQIDAPKVNAVDTTVGIYI